MYVIYVIMDVFHMYGARVCVCKESTFSNLIILYTYIASLALLVFLFRGLLVMYVLSLLVLWRVLAGVAVALLCL